VVLAFDELPNPRLSREARGPVCPDCFADMRDEPMGSGGSGVGDALRHRCTRCGAGWERNAAGWLFPLHAA
jgi:hypothetical protein